MTDLLEEAIAELHKLPAPQQDAMAQLILDELVDEQQWDQQFERTQHALGRLAEKVRSDIRNGRTEPVGIDQKSSTNTHEYTNKLCYGRLHRR